MLVFSHDLSLSTRNAEDKTAELLTGEDIAMLADWSTYYSCMIQLHEGRVEKYVNCRRSGILARAVGVPVDRCSGGKYLFSALLLNVSRFCMKNLCRFLLLKLCGIIF